MSLPPLMENGPHDEATVVEQDDDEDEIPSAHSPSEDVEENEEDPEPQLKRRKRKNVDSTARSSPLKEVVAEGREASESSSDASVPEGPLSVPPLNSAPATAFGRMETPPMSSEDDDVNR